MPRLARKVAAAAALPLLAFVALAAWALSSPIGSSPDEDYHLVSIWCGDGTSAGTCEAAPKADERKVPEALLNAACFAFHPEVSGACQESWFHPEDHKLVATTRGNFTGDYPPVYYFAMRLLVGNDISRSVVLMRLVNAALFVGLMTAAYRFVPRNRRPMLLVGSAVTLVPLGVFLIPSINPSSWAIISSAVVFPAMVGFFESAGRRRIGAAVVAAVAVVMGAGARADAALYAAMGVVLAALVCAAWRQRDWKVLSFPALLCVVCAAFYLSAGQTSAASQGAAAGSGAGMDKIHQIAYNLANVPGLWAGVFGSWGLGWLDTAMPSVVWVLNLAVFGGVVFAGLRRTDARKTVAVVVLVLAAWLIPTWVLLQTSDLVGAGVQPRYLLPLLVMLAQVALFRVDARPIGCSRAQVLAAAAALFVTDALALHIDLQRYVAGGALFKLDLDARREWWWGIPVSPTAVWLLGSVAFGVAMLLCAGLLLRRRDAIAEVSSADRQPDRLIAAA